MPAVFRRGVSSNENQMNVKVSYVGREDLFIENTSVQFFKIKNIKMLLHFLYLNNIDYNIISYIL